MKRLRNSLRARLLVGLVALIALVSALAGWLTYGRVLDQTAQLFDYELRQMALTLRGQISLAPRIELPQDQGDSDVVIQIQDPFGARVYLSRPGLPTMPQAPLGYVDLLLRGERWRMYSMETRDGVIQIAQPWTVRERLARRAAVRVAVPLLVLLPALALAIVAIVGRGLAPLRRVTAEVQRRDAHSLKPIEPPANLPDEVAPLIGELNRLLGRLDIAFDAQRAFVADAAHELRSPLTALRLQLQLLDRAPDEAARQQAREALGAGIARAIHLVEQLLTLARNEPEAAPAAMKPVALDDIARQGIADVHAYAASRDTELSLDAPAPVNIAGDAAALRILVRNLVDNAVRYSPPRSAVQAAVFEHDGAAVLQVDDAGPGIPADDRERIFDRFYRREGATEGGSGLGLAIVKAIADRHGALLTLDRAPSGGLRVQLRFGARGA